MSLEDISFEARDQLAELAKTLADNPKTREHFLRLAKYVKPDLPTPELDIKDNTNNAINEIRQHPRQCGQQYFSAAKPLSWNNNLYQGASAHSKDMANNNFLGHVGSTGLDLRARLKKYHMLSKANGENVASGQKTLNE